MKYKPIILLIITMLILSTAGCFKKSETTSTELELNAKQKMIVVVVDKQTKAPVKDAKVCIVGDNTIYTTDEMGKTPEILVDINKDYFNKYVDEVANKMNCGFVNIVAIKTGYAKHMEMDYSLFPGNSTAIAKVEISKNKKITSNCNMPDVNYIENLVKAYEKFEGQGLKADNMIKYKVAVTDDAKKALEGVKLVIPEAKMVVSTNKKGIAEFEIPYDDTSYVNYPVKKDYGEITILAYKDGCSPRAIFRVHVNKDGKNNTMTIRMKKSEKPKIDYEIVQPRDSWIEQIINSYNQ